MIRGASLSFIEPCEYQERIRPAQVEITPTARGDFHATLSQLELHRLTLQHGWQSLPIVARCGLHQSRSTIFFHTGTPQTAAKVDGVNLEPGIFALCGQGEEHFLQTSTDATWASLTLTAETYAAARSALIGDDFDLTLRTNIVRPRKAAMDGLRAMHQQIRTAFSTAPAQALHPEVEKAAEYSLLTAVIDCLWGNEDRAGLRLGERNSTVIMRRLYELLDASEGLPLYLIDVCARLGVSRRTLHNACVEHLGLSPYRFLWLRRMQLARQALLRSEPARGAVTKVATDLGFWELGRFSVHYRRLFGESPTATLVRRSSAASMRR
ncbi:MAG: helix-turn-helix domain-containing protein [Acetobacteraceae bacterium]